MEIRFGFDFGNSRSKLSYSYVNGDKIIETKIVEFYGENDGIASIAFYDEEEDTWIFGDESLTGAYSNSKPIISLRSLLLNINSESLKSNSFVNPAYDFHFISKTLTVGEVLQEYFKYVLITLKNKYFDNKKINATITNKIVLTYPVSASDEYKRLLKQFVETCGYQVIRMLPEPVATGLSIIDQLQNYKKDILVVDIGSDTTEVATINPASKTEGSVQKPDFKVMSINNMKIGGVDFDKKIFDYIIEEADALTNGEELTSFKKFELLEDCRTSKQYLSKNEFCNIAYESFVVFNIELGRDKYNELISSLVDEIVEFIEGECSKSENIGKVILSGGISATPIIVSKVKQIVKDRGYELVEPENPLYSSSFGAAIECQERYNLINASAKSYGIMCIFYNDNGTRSKDMSALIAKNQRLPFNYSRTFYTHKIGQKIIAIEVGESDAMPVGKLNRIPNEKTKILLNTQFTITNPSLTKKEPVDFEISIDQDGIATITIKSNHGDVLTTNFTSKLKK